MDSDELLGSNAPPQGGSFRFYLDGQRWEWSDPVARMHGYRPGEITPTTELLLSHKHPDDHAQVAALFDKMIHAGAPFSSKHRIIDTDRRIHHVIVVGDRMLDEHGQVIGTSGYYIDVTETLETDPREFNAALTEAVAELEKSRAVIEQAKGRSCSSTVSPPNGPSASSPGAPSRPTPNSASSPNASSTPLPPRRPFPRRLAPGSTTYS